MPEWIPITQPRENQVFRVVQESGLDIGDFSWRTDPGASDRESSRTPYSAVLVHGPSGGSFHFEVPPRPGLRAPVYLLLGRSPRLRCGWRPTADGDFNDFEFRNVDTWDDGLDLVRDWIQILKALDEP